jgi:methyltransferase (TIGR00027 family)
MKTNTPSQTAYWVALGSLVVLKQERRLVWDSRITELLTLFLKDAPVSFRFMNGLSKWSWARVMLDWSMSLLIPGMFLHYVARKKKIEELTRASLQNSIQQLVVVSGGFDTLSLRLGADRVDVTCFEVDHPATQKSKVKSLRKSEKNVCFIPADLTQSLLSIVLKTAPKFLMKPTVFVIEGVLMYLTEENVARLFEDLSQFPQGTQVVFTFFEKSEGPIGFHKGKQRIVNSFLVQSKEPFLWSIHVSELAVFLAAMNWKLLGTYKAEDMVLPYVPLGFHRAASGECVAVVEKK